MKTRRITKVLLAAVNLLGLACLVLLSVRYLRHDTTVANPDAMLPMQDWDGAGLLLTLGLGPMIAANTTGFLFLLSKECPLALRLLLFVPSLCELVLVIHYLIISFQ
ncbi:MAG: hypothetical protein J5851_06940 [Oscillospiraceae bacterium]|nr:hypothetical protein [Oscillospiraceae bacterium]